MAFSRNHVELAGHLGRDPDVRTNADGSKMVTLNLASSESWKDKTTGERKEKTEWHRVVIFNDGLARVAESYLRKGSGVWIVGSLQTRKWTGQDGQDKYSTEVVVGMRGEMRLMDNKPKDASAAPAAPAFDDDIPF